MSPVRTEEPPYGKARIGLVEPGPGEVDAQAIDVRREGQLAGRYARSYQGVPPVKKSTWEWYIAVYFWLAGIASGSWLAAAAEELAGGGDRGVVRAGRYLALGGVLGGTALLIADLGRPERFLDMLRVFRARSAMNLGSWGLSAFGGVAAAAAALQLAEDVRGPDSRSGRLSRGWPGRTLHLAGLPLALFIGSYTGVLLASTSTPAWARRRHVLPPLFLAAGASNGFAAVSAAVELGGSASPVARHRLERAETIALATELALVGADRALARTLPSVRQAPGPVKLARWLTIGGIAAPLAARAIRRIRPAKKASRRELARRVERRLTGRSVPSRAGLAASALVLGSGLALRLLVTREGDRSADTPEDTWAFAGKDGRKRSVLPPELAERQTRPDGR